MKNQMRLAILLSLLLILLLSAFATVSGEESTNVTWQRYEDGTLMLDEEGNPIAIVPEGVDVPVAYQRDENGSLVLDESGNPIVTETASAVVVAVAAELCDEDASPVLDESSEPVVTEAVPAVVDAPAAEQVDEDASPVLDESSEPVVTEAAPEGAEKIKTIVDADRTIDIYLLWVSEERTFGGTAMLTAVLNGYNDAPYTIQWQTSKDCLEWVDVPGATTANLYVVVTAENYLDYWRVVVTVAE